MKRNWLFWLSFFVLPFLIFSCKKDSSTTLLGNWVEPGQISGAGRVGAVCFTIADSVYYGLGYNSYNKPKYLLDFYKYDINTNHYQKLSSFQGIGRSDAVAFSVNGKGYVGSGFNSETTANSYLDDFWEYTPSTNSWKQVAHIPSVDPNYTGRRNAVAFTINNIGYVGSGYSNTYLKDFWKYTPSADTGSWTQINDLPFARSNAVAFVVDTVAYVVTGDNNGVYSQNGADRLYKYSPKTDVWFRLRDIANTPNVSYDDNYNIVRSNAVVFVWKDITQSNKTFAYITTGANSSMARADTWEYDVLTDLWKQKTSFPNARMGAISFSVNNRMFIATGKNGSSYYSDMWEFKPNDTYSTSN